MPTILKERMSEPVSTTAGAFSAKFVISSGIGSVVAAVIVMAMAYPKSKREFLAALTSTLAASVFGGAALIEYFQLSRWTLEAQGGLFVIAGLPAWVIIRAFYVWSEVNKGAGLLDLIKQIKDVWRS